MITAFLPLALLIAEAVLVKTASGSKEELA